MALHEQSVGASNEWYTPKHVFDALGCSFDMDVASPGADIVPWVPSNFHITAGSLETPWSGFVWMNPPFGARNGLVPWLDKFFTHGNGVCLVPDRTSTDWWQDAAHKSRALLFVRGKLKFISGDGRQNKSPAQGTTLMAAGDDGLWALARASAYGLGHMEE